jgi:hypothetical protein
MSAYAFGSGLVLPNGVVAAMAPFPALAAATAALVGFAQFTVGACAALLVGSCRPGTVAGMATVIGGFACAGLVVVAWLRAGASRAAALTAEVGA